MVGRIFKQCRRLIIFYFFEYYLNKNVAQARSLKNLGYTYHVLLRLHLRLLGVLAEPTVDWDVLHCHDALLRCQLVWRHQGQEL